MKASGSPPAGFLRICGIGRAVDIAPPTGQALACAHTVKVDSAPVSLTPKQEFFAAEHLNGIKAILGSAAQVA
jgi:hypothetical protein